VKEKEKKEQKIEAKRRNSDFEVNSGEAKNVEGGFSVPQKKSKKKRGER